jgi:hypothetical protein
MPWKESHVIDERLRLVARLLESENMAINRGRPRAATSPSRASGHPVIRLPPPGQVEVRRTISMQGPFGASSTLNSTLSHSRGSSNASPFRDQLSLLRVFDLVGAVALALADRLRAHARERR